MAHQPDKIPWAALASHLRPVMKTCDPANAKQVSNLHLRCENGQSEQLTAFKDAFTSAIEAAATAERARYPAKYKPPKEDDVIVSDELALRITPAVQRWREDTFGETIDEQLSDTVQERQQKEKAKVLESRAEVAKALAEADGEVLDAAPDGAPTDEWEDEPKLPRVSTNTTELCSHQSSPYVFRCRCILPLHERRAGAFLREKYHSDCYEFFKLNSKQFFNVEVVKTLILAGELDPILRICARPDHDLEEWHNAGECMCVGYIAGWDMLYDFALSAYVSLNLSFCFPELWPATEGTEPIGVNDYRRTYMYQSTINECTGVGATSDLLQYAHTDFFGTADCSFINSAMSNPDTDPLGRGGAEVPSYLNRCGSQAYDDFLKDNAQRNPPETAKLTPEVETAARRAMCANGLPEELVMAVLDYSQPSHDRLVVPHDPMHPRNRVVLMEYLEECWMVMVRCSVVAEEMGLSLNWKDLIGRQFYSRLSGPQHVLRDQLYD